VAQLEKRKWSDDGVSLIGLGQSAGNRKAVNTRKHPDGALKLAVAAVRLKIFALYGVLIAANMLAWAWAFASLHG
jgi:hypothetical protein